jgi:hypothetical protein
VTTSLTSCDDGGSDESTATGLLVLRTEHPGAAALDRLYAALDERGFRRGHLVGPVFSVTAPSGDLQMLERYVAASGTDSHPPGADTALLDALAPVERFAWDEGAETF